MKPVRAKVMIQCRFSVSQTMVSKKLKARKWAKSPDHCRGAVTKKAKARTFHQAAVGTCKPKIATRPAKLSKGSGATTTNLRGCRNWITPANSSSWPSRKSLRWTNSTKVLCHCFLLQSEVWLNFAHPNFARFILLYRWLYLPTYLCFGLQFFYYVWVLPRRCEQLHDAGPSANKECVGKANHCCSQGLNSPQRSSFELFYY